jgi:hypothetical protein
MWKRVEPTVFRVAVVGWAAVAATFLLFHNRVLDTGAKTSSTTVTNSVAPRTVDTHAAKLQPPPRHPAPLGRLSVWAARGDSWVVVRRTSATGLVVFEGLLRQGRTLKADGKTFWLRLAAAGNLNVLVNGRRVRGLSGTVDVVLRPQRGPHG